MGCVRIYSLPMILLMDREGLAFNEWAEHVNAATSAADGWDWTRAYLDYIRDMPYPQWLIHLDHVSSVAADPKFWAIMGGTA